MTTIVVFLRIYLHLCNRVKNALYCEIETIYLQPNFSNPINFQSFEIVDTTTSKN